MGPSKNVRTISQEAFDGLVRENMEDLGMDPSEALQDAIETLNLQGVDLSGIVKCVPGVSSVVDNPVIHSLDRLRKLNSDTKDQFSDKDLEEVAELLDKLHDLCSAEGLGNVAIAARNGGVELVCSIFQKLRCDCERSLVSALRTMALLLHDIQTTETFRKCSGPTIVMGILNGGAENLDLLNSGFSAIASAATGNEILKELFMELKIDELFLKLLRKQDKGCILSLYDAIRILLTPDDNRVVASQVYGYARKFAKVGIAGALVDSIRDGLGSSNLIQASIALKAVAVNDEICRSIADNGGIDVFLQIIDDSGGQGNKTVAKAFCSLLSKVAGSDSNKAAIVEKGGMDRLIRLAARFSDDPSVIQEVMSIICTLSLRSPENAARAIEAGAGDLAIEAMQNFPQAHLLQRNSCLMIRNLVVRNPENRALLLNNGIEKIIRKAKENHESCKDAATAALRDLGLDNYNS